MILRWYQVEAKAAIYDYLAKKQGNPVVVLATGSGKTNLLASICADVSGQWGGRVLVLAHVKELLQQAVEKLQGLLSVDMVGIYSAGLRSRDTSHPVIVAGIQSVYKRAGELGAFSVIIVDEAHLISPNEGTMYRTFIEQAKIVNPKVRIVGLTATPYRMDCGEICSEDGILNDVCYEVGVRELIVQGFLCPLKTRAGGSHPDLDGVHTRGGEYIESEMAERMDAIVSVACEEVCALTIDRHSVLIFASSLAHGRHVQTIISDITKQEVGFVCGDSESAEREELLKRFKGGSLKFLVNMNVLTTGFDAPNVDTIVLMRATLSPGLYSQMVGRGLRIHPSKSDCIAEGQMVLTDVGLVPIEQVTKSMKLWDGVEFVSHCGVVFRGELPVVSYAGLTATEDHNVWTESGWQTMRDTIEKQDAIAETGVDGVSVKLNNCYFRRSIKGRQEESTISSDQMRHLRTGKTAKLRQRYQTSSGMQKMWEKEKLCKALPRRSCMVIASVHSGKGQMHEQQEHVVEELRREGNQVQLSKPKHDGTVDYAKFENRQNKRDRSDRQQWELRAGKSSIGVAENKHEQSAKKQRNAQNASIQDIASRDKIRRCNSGGTPRTERCNILGCDKKILPEIMQAKRRVWDILNAGPRHRFTCEGLLVSNCIVLDYGENTVRHGPIDAITVKKPGEGEGEAPAKECPQCHAVVFAGLAVCTECGFEFPREDHKHKEKAGRAGVLSGEVTTTEYTVTDVRFYDHAKRDCPEAPHTMRVEYEIQQFPPKVVKEWVCLDHEGYARQKAERWWRDRSLIPCPSSVDNGIALAKAGALAKTLRVTYREITGKPFGEIIGVEIADEKPTPADVDAALIQQDRICDEFDPEPGAAGNWFDEISDDIPF
jgi:superfamily II DNA or RNA helicase